MAGAPAVHVDADVELASQSGTRTMRWDEFITGPKRTARQPGEIIVGVRLPDHLPDRQAFAKVGVRNAMVISIASACLVRYRDGTTRIALGSVGPTPIRAGRAEDHEIFDLAPSRGSECSLDIQTVQMLLLHATAEPQHMWKHNVTLMVAAMAR